MDIKKKIQFGIEELIEHGPITIVALGDSVTHGSVAFSDEMDYESVYWNRLRKKILAVNDFIPVNVINAGIGGGTAFTALKRLDKQVLAHSPDLVIVCFGLNDINHPLEHYTESLRSIFERCRNAGADVIYMTPNMLNTYVAEDVEDRYREYAAVTADIQNNGQMDRYIDGGRAAATEMGVTVCDCYARWKELSKTQDTTVLLANRINHPSREMHELFAECLFRQLFPEKFNVENDNNSTMFVDQKH